jgi:ABC-type multidrug transport system ATPase subunit
MGPSGSGKTTLLSLLGGRAPAAARQAGRVLFDKEPLTKSKKRQIGYVLQVRESSSFLQ